MGIGGESRALNRVQDGPSGIRWSMLSVQRAASGVQGSSFEISGAASGVQDIAFEISNAAPGVRGTVVNVILRISDGGSSISRGNNEANGLGFTIPDVQYGRSYAFCTVPTCNMLQKISGAPC